MKTKESKSKKLLVEGSDDQSVIWALCKKYEIEESFDVIDCESIENLKNEIPVRLKQSLEIDTIGIVIDADENSLNSWDSIKNILNGFGFRIPKKIPETGCVNISNGLKKVSVWIMPDNKTKGMIEDFLFYLIPESDKLKSIAEQTLNLIERDGLNKYLLAHKPKALIYTWLAWQEKPGSRMGQAITYKYLSNETPVFLNFIKWIRETFN